MLDLRGIEDAITPEGENDGAQAGEVGPTRGVVETPARTGTLGRISSETVEKDRVLPASAENSDKSASKGGSTTYAPALGLSSLNPEIGSPESTATWDKVLSGMF